MNHRKFTLYIVPNLGAVLVLLLALTGKLGAQGNGATTTQAAATTISYQGRLTDVNNQPVSAAMPMTFRLYATPGGGTAVWTESRSGANAVPVTNGLFNVQLGSVTPIDTGLLNQELWLGFSVDGDAEMSPREKLGSVPYAARAGTVPDGSITSAKQTIRTFYAEDSKPVRLQGQNEVVVSEFRFDNVPSGEVAVVSTLIAVLNAGGSNNGNVWMEVDGKRLEYGMATHTVPPTFTQLTLHGRLMDFSGGVLVVRIKAQGELPNTDLIFGVMANGDGRFGRRITVMAGL